MQTSFSASSSSSSSSSLRPWWCGIQYALNGPSFFLGHDGTGNSCSLSESMWQSGLGASIVLFRLFFFSPPFHRSVNYWKRLLVLFSDNVKISSKLFLHLSGDKTSSASSEKSKKAANITASHFFFFLLQSFSNSTGNKSRNKSFGFSRLHKLKDFFVTLPPGFCLLWMKKPARMHGAQHADSTLSHY